MGLSGGGSGFKHKSVCVLTNLRYTKKIGRYVNS